MTIKENISAVIPKDAVKTDAAQHAVPTGSLPLPPEYGGRKNAPEATRYGDWELNGKRVDF